MNGENMELMSRTDEEKLYVNETALNASKTEVRPLYEEHDADDCEDNEELYDEYIYDRDYEGYKFSFQEIVQRKQTSNVKNAQLTDKSLHKILIFTLLLFFIVLVLVIGLIVVVLGQHYTRASIETSQKDAVLILSTHSSSHTPFPMVVGLNG